MTEIVEETVSQAKSFEIAIPPPAESMSQDREWCVACIDGEWRKIRFHDYDEIYAVPGLYEALFYEVLRCKSPETIRELLATCLERENVDPADLRVLDLGAGNGMVGEQLADLGVRTLVGVDIIEEAKEALDRDRGSLYDSYVVADLTDPSPRAMERLKACRYNAMTCVAALGFGDIPTEAFLTAFRLVEKGGWIAFNIKQDFLQRDDDSGFSRLMRRMIEDGTLEVLERKDYRHRLATCGEPLIYTAFVARKTAEVDAEALT